MGFKADLHCHSTCSDGTLTPIELIDLAIERGLSGLSITDHDTVSAYETAIPYAKSKNLPLLIGAEFSTMYRDVPIHILAYSFSVDSSIIIEFCNRHKERRLKKIEMMLSLMKKNGVPLTEKDIPLEKEGTIGRPHLASAMVKKGYVSSVQEAFKKYLGDNECCYVAGEPFDVDETLEVIHAAGGIASLAHPHLIKQKPILRNIIDKSFDAIEAYYACFPITKERKWIETAEAKGWIITGGSDFHGDIKPHIPLGASWVDEKTFQRLLHQNKKHV